MELSIRGSNSRGGGLGFRARAYTDRRFEDQGYVITRLFHVGHDGGNAIGFAHRFIDCLFAFLTEHLHIRVHGFFSVSYRRIAPSIQRAKAAETLKPASSSGSFMARMSDLTKCLAGRQRRAKCRARTAGQPIGAAREPSRR